MLQLLLLNSSVSFHWGQLHFNRTSFSDDERGGSTSASSLSRLSLYTLHWLLMVEQIAALKSDTVLALQKGLTGLSWINKQDLNIGPHSSRLPSVGLPPAWGVAVAAAGGLCYSASRAAVGSFPESGRRRQSQLATRVWMCSLKLVQMAILDLVCISVSFHSWEKGRAEMRPAGRNRKWGNQGPKQKEMFTLSWLWLYNNLSKALQLHKWIFML